MSAFGKSQRYGQRVAPSICWALPCLFASIWGCETEPPPRQPPPPEPRAAVSCDTPPKFNDPRNAKNLPPRVGGYCLDPSGADRGYGVGAKKAITGIREQFDGEAEIYLGFGVKRVVEARYIDGGGSGTTVDLNLSVYPTASRSLAMFSKRTVGTSDPAHPDSPRAVKAGDAAALGVGNAYLWKGLYLAELTLNHSEASPKAIRQAADKILPRFLKALAERLPGSKSSVPELNSLPTKSRLPLGFRYLTKNILAVKASGPGVMGYYRDGSQRWRQLSILKKSPQQAEATLKTLCSPSKASSGRTNCSRTTANVKDLGAKACSLTMRCPGRPTTRWLIAQWQNHVRGIGDEERVLRQGQTSQERKALCLPEAQKRSRLQADWKSATP